MKKYELTINNIQTVHELIDIINPVSFAISF